MSTSLAEQLKLLTVPQTSIFKNPTKGSLLFDKHEAASIRKEQIYEIGSEGFKELLSKNPAFKQFESTLFHVTSKNFERSVQSKEANEKVNKLIKKFLLYLSPYVLLASAQKALEWLIHRYMINRFNRDELLLLALPYHESSIFVKILQNVEIQDNNDNWYFLKKFQKNNVCLPKQCLLNHAASDIGFLKTLSNYMNQLIELHININNLVVSVNLCCTAFLGVIEYSPKITEIQIVQMLPLVLKGIHSKLPDFAASTYVIAARLLIKTTLPEKILNTLLTQLSQVKCTSLKLEALLVLIIIYQSQDYYKEMPREAVKNLSEKEWLAKSIQYLNSNGTVVYPFLRVLLKESLLEILREDSQLCRSMVMNVLGEVKLDDFFVGEFLCIIADIVDPKLNYPTESNEHLHEIIQQLENQYPEAFDTQIRKIFTDSCQTEKKLSFQKFLGKSTIFQDKYEIFNILYQPEEKLKKETLIPLLSKFESLKESDRDLIRHLLLNKLNSDSPKLIEDTLKIFKVYQILDEDSFKKSLFELVKNKNCLRDEWAKVFFTTANTMLSNQSFEWKLFLTILPNLIHHSPVHLKKIKNLFSRDFFTSDDFFKPFCDTVKEMTDGAEFRKKVFQFFEDNQKLELVEEILKGIGDVSDFVVVDVLSRLVPHKCPVEVSVPILEELIKHSTNSSTNTCLERIVAKTNLPKLDYSQLDFSQTSIESRYLKLVFSITDPHSDLMETILTHLGSKINLLLNLVASGAKNLLVSVKKYLKVVLDDITGVYVLVLVGSLDGEVREEMMGLMEILVRGMKKSGKFYGLFEEVLRHREEICMDKDQVSVVVGNFLSRDSSSQLTETLVSKFCDPNVPVYIRANLLNALSHLNSFEILESLTKNISDIFTESVIEGHKCEIYVNLVNRFERALVTSIKITSNSWRFIKFALKSKNKAVVEDKTTSLSALMLNQLNQEGFNLLPDDILEELLDVVSELAATTDSSETLSLCSSFFKHMDLNALLIKNILEKMRDVETRKRKTSEAQTINVLDTVDWKKGICVLEYVQNKKKIKNSERLLSLFFDLLRKCLSFEEQSAVEYPKQLLLSTLLLVFNKIDSSNLTENALNIELIIECIRASQNPQTHYHALLVLGEAARLVPNQVLHQIMTIFTFMGSSLLRHDDVYSFEIISKIIDSIIPILVNDNDKRTIVKVLRVFVDAMLDVPEHRRIKLYKRLLVKLETKKYLYMFLLLVFETHVFRSGGQKVPVDKDSKTQRLNIAKTILQQFPSDTVLNTLIQLIKYLSNLPEKFEEKIENVDFELSISNCTEKQFRHFKYVIVTYVHAILVSKEFVDEISGLKNEESQKLEGCFKELIVIVLGYIQKVQKMSEKDQGSPQGNYWRHLLHNCYDILDSVNALLSPHMFLLVIKGLALHNINNAKRRALELFNNKLQQHPEFFNECEEKEIYILIPPLLSIIETVNQEDQEVLVQTALFSLKLLTKTLAGQSPATFVKILDFIIKLLKSGNAQGNVLASVVLCLAELCACLRAHAIPCLSSFMPTILKLLKSQRNQDTSTLLFISVITSLYKIIDSLPLFLSPYLTKILLEVSILITKWGHDTTDPKLLPIINKLNCFKQKIGALIPLRVLLPCIEETYNALLKKQNYKSVVVVFDILSESLNNLTSNEANIHTEELLSFFKLSLRFRSESNLALTETNRVEERIVNALKTLIFKLSEKSFRDVYVKLFEWAAINNQDKNRLVTFYHLSSALAESLKGLFVLFAGHFFNNSVQVLTDSSDHIILIEFVLKTLRYVFQHDTQKFVNRDRFSSIMQPLIDQLESSLESLKDRNESLITPTIVNLAVAVGDDSMWKQLNYQILLKMRNAAPEVRLAALHCLTELVGKLGDEFLPLLPETIPFLAELLEDEQEEVEKACQKAVNEMEKVLGEPLQKYF